MLRLQLGSDAEFGIRSIYFSLTVLESIERPRNDSSPSTTGRRAAVCGRHVNVPIRRFQDAYETSQSHKKEINQRVSVQTQFNFVP